MKQRGLVITNETEIYFLYSCRATEGFQTISGDIDTVRKLQSFDSVNSINTEQNCLEMIVGELSS
jgi:hypothetical protein